MAFLTWREALEAAGLVAQDRGQPLARWSGLEDRRDDCGARDDQDGADHDGRLRRQSKQQPCEEAGAGPGSSPPSNRTMATAMLTSGENAAPKSLSGFTAGISAPAANPTDRSTMIPGMRSFVAMIWQATAKPTMRAMPRKI
jgi:hypothetical protein